MDPLSIIAATISIVGAISKAYDVVKTVKGLPNAFEEVNKKLPLVNRNLRAVESRLLASGPGPNLSDEEKETVAEIVATCRRKADKLHKIFQALETRRTSDSEATSWAKVRTSYRKALAGIKSHRVETLMKGILKSIEELALIQVLETATKGDLQEIERAIKELSQVPSSLEDLELDGARGITADLSVASGGNAQQNNVQGDNNTFSSGENVVHGSGHTIYFAHRVIHTHNSQPQPGSSGDQDDSDHADFPDHEYSNLPSIHVSHFVGRTALLETIRETFAQPSKTSPSSCPAVVVLSGIGGLGKSQAALRYCHLSRGYRAKFWVNASSKQTTVLSFEKIAAELAKKPPSRKPKSTLPPLVSGQFLPWQDVVGVLTGWDERWLLVFDNYDNEKGFSGPDTAKDETFSKLADFFPSSKKGSIIITSRDARVGAGCPDWTRFRVEDMSESEALDLLGRSSPQKVLAEEELKAGKAIVRKLGYLPLAIEHAARFISKYTSGFQEYYSRRFSMPGGNSWNSFGDDAKSANWLTTYEHSLDSLDPDTRKETTSFLTLAAFFGDAAIYEGFFAQYCAARADETGGPSWLSLFGVGTKWELLSYRDCVAELADRSLVLLQRDGPNGFHFTLHPVIREWLLGRNGSADVVDHASVQVPVAAATVAAFLRGSNIHSMSLKTRLDVLTHINKFVESGLGCLYESPGPDATYDAANLMAVPFAIFCREFSRVPTAKSLLQKTLQFRVDAGLPEVEPVNVRLLVELGRTFAENDEFRVAEGYFSRALTHAGVLDGATRCQALVGQAEAMRAQGHPRRALGLAKQALDLASDLPDSGGRLQIQAMLAMACSGANVSDIGKMEKLAKEAFAKAESGLGANDNLTIQSELATARFRIIRGYPDEAKDMIQSALSKIEAHNGLDHGLALLAFSMLGQLCGFQRSHAEARRWFEQSKTRSRVLYGDAPGGMALEVTIGETYEAEGGLERAKRIFDKCVEESRDREGYEMVYTYAKSCQSRVRLKKSPYARALLYLGDFLRFFPFRFFLKRNKLPLLLAVGLCLMVLESGLRGHLLGPSLVCAVIAILWYLV